MTLRRCGLCGTPHDSMRAALECCTEYFEDDDPDTGTATVLTDGGQVEACPECRSASINRRIPTAPDSAASDERRYRCSECGTTFDEPITRDRQGHATVGGSDAAQALVGADPEVVPDGGADLVEALAEHGTLYASLRTKASSVDTVHVERDCPQLTKAAGVKAIADRSELPLRAAVCGTCTGTAAVADTPDWSAWNALSEAEDLEDLRTDGGASYCAACHRAVAREDRVEHDGEVYHRECAPDDVVDHRTLDDLETDGGTPLDRQVQCECGRVCASTWEYCPGCGSTLGDEYTGYRPNPDPAASNGGDPR